jgi:hypothetical protein
VVVFCHLLREKRRGAEIFSAILSGCVYEITIPGARDLQREIPNPTFNYPSGLYALANAYIEINISKNDPEIAAIRREGWPDIPLSFEQVKYAALDARLGFEIARKCFQLAGYKTI